MKRNILLFGIIIISSVGQLFAISKEDSLKNVINTYKSRGIQDTNVVICYSELGFLQLSKDMNLAIKYANIALQISEKINYETGKINAYNVKAQVYSQQSIEDSTLKYIKMVENLSIKNNNKIGLSASYASYGTYYYAKGNLDKAMDYYYKAIKIAEANKLYLSIASISMNLCRIFLDQSDKKRALEKINTAIEIYLKSNNKSSISAALLLKGNVYLTFKDSDSAEIYFKQSLKLSIEAKDYLRINNILSNLAIVYADKGDFKQAIEIEKKILETESIPRKLANAYINLSFYYYSIKNYAQSYNYASKGLKIADLYDLKDEKQYLYENISDILSAQGKYKDALDNYKKFVAVKDTLFSQENMKRYNEVNIKYETEKKERKISDLNKEKEYGLLIQNTLIIGLSGLVLIIFIIIYLYLNKKKIAERLALTNSNLENANSEISLQKETLEKQEIQLIEANAQLRNINFEINKKNYELEQLNMEKNEFLGIAAHDLKNPLSTISMAAFTIKNYYSKMTTEKLFTLTENIEKTSKRMTDIISNLLDINAIDSGKLSTNYSDIIAGDILIEVVESYREKAENKHITLTSEIQVANSLIHYDERILREILDNLLSNAIKFSDENTNILISMFVDQSGAYILSFKDEGPGLSDEDKKKLFSKYSKLSARPTAGENSTGLGLSIVKKLANALNSDVICESEIGMGATFSLIIPKFAIEKENIYAKYNKN